jgi:hypothetical protein
LILLSRKTEKEEARKKETRKTKEVIAVVTLFREVKVSASKKIEVWRIVVIILCRKIFGVVINNNSVD